MRRFGDLPDGQKPRHCCVKGAVRSLVKVTGRIKVYRESIIKVVLGQKKD